MYRTDPDPARRLKSVIFAGAMIHEVLLKIGDALCALWRRPGFFLEYMQPMLRRVEEVIDALEIIDTAKRLEI